MPDVFVKVIAGPEEGKVLNLNNTTITIGRDKKNDIVLNDKAISKFHATINFNNDKFIIQDHSKNGTFVNGMKVKETILKDGDLVSIGRSKLRILSELENETVILEERTKIREIVKKIQEKPFSQEPPPSKRKIRPIMIVVPTILIILGLIYLVSSKQNKDTAQKPTLSAPSPKDKNLLVDIQTEWRKLNIENITNKQLKFNLNYGKQKYDEQEWLPGNLYEAIITWKQTLSSLDLERKRILEKIIDTAEKELDSKIERAIDDAKIFSRQGQKKQTALKLQEIIQMIPDPDHPVHRWAKGYLDGEYKKYL